MIVHHPFVFHVGTLEVTGFGLAVLLAFVIAQFICQRELVCRGGDPAVVGPLVSELVFAALFGTLVGAKLYYVLIITHHPSDFFTRGGFVFWGGFLGAVATTTFVIRRRRAGFWRVSDVAGIAIAAGYAVGRTGCWAVGDDYGRPWDSRWAVRFPEGAPPSTAANMASLFHVTLPPGTPPDAVIAVYPTQLLEAALGFLMFLALWRLRDHRREAGWLFGLYCVLAGVERFLVEFLRAKDDRFFGGVISSAQVMALAVGVVGVIVMIARRRATGERRTIVGPSATPAAGGAPPGTT